MRKILLGTTAVVGLAALAAAEVRAQTAPAVTLNGFARFYGAYADQDNDKSAATGGTETGEFDFNQNAEITVNVRGTTAGGIAYGAQIEIQFDASANSTAGDLDEMFLFLNSPSLGVVQMGNNEGAGNQFYTGSVANFATGGVDGDANQFITDGQNRGTYFTQDTGDNTKIIYRSPQFFGFDFGASWAFNEGEGTIDRAFTGDRLDGQAGGNFDRITNIGELAARYTGTFGGFGFAIGGGYQFADPVDNTTPGGASPEDWNNYFIGLQVSFAGFTLGGTYSAGDHNGGTNTIRSGDEEFSQYFIGASYRIGAFTIGANYYSQDREGSFIVPVGRTTSDSLTASGYSLGATYNFAPGLDFIAEYTTFKMEETGAFTVNGVGGQDEVETSVFILGARLSF